MFDLVIEGLRGAIEGLVVGVDSPELTELLALHDQLDAQIAGAVAAFDDAGLWDDDGRTSMRDWLRVRGRMTSGEAMRAARRALRLRDLPHVSASYRDGRLSTSQVDTICAYLTDRRRPTFTDIEADLTPRFEDLDAAAVDQIMREWASAFDDSHPEPLPDEPESTLHCSRTTGDRGEVRGSFSADDTALIEAALAVATGKDAEGELRIPSERRADAFLDMCKFFLDHHDKPTRRRHAPHVSTVLTPEQITGLLAGETLLGHPLSGPGIATLLCDCSIRRIVIAEGEVLEMGRTIRTVPAPLFAAVAARDRGCRYPGCDRPAHWCDAHHVVHWEHGGHTNVGNLVLLCRRHHTKIHRRHWHAKLLPDATFQITTPTGKVLTSRPPRPGPLL